MTDLFYTLGLVALLGVWIISGVIVLSYSRLQSVLKYVQAVCTLPLVFLLVVVGVILSAKAVHRGQVWLDSLSGPAWLVLLMVLVSFVLIVPLIVLLLWGWFRLLYRIEQWYRRAD